MSEATKAMHHTIKAQYDQIVALEAENAELRDTTYAWRTVDRLSSENARLRELVVRIWNAARLMDANKHIDGMRITDDLREECERAFDELGIEVR